MEEVSQLTRTVNCLFRFIFESNMYQKSHAPDAKPEMISQEMRIQPIPRAVEKIEDDQKQRSVLPINFAKRTTLNQPRENEAGELVYEKKNIKDILGQVRWTHKNLSPSHLRMKSHF